MTIAATTMDWIRKARPRLGPPDESSLLLPGEPEPPVFSAIADDVSALFSEASAQFPSDGENPLEECAATWDFVRAFVFRGMATGWNEKNLFRLARELRWVGFEPTPETMHRAGFRWACQRFDQNFEETVRTLRAMWEKVRTTPQDNNLIRAMALADERWPEFEIWGVQGNRAKLLAIMYFLHLLAPNLAYVILPRARIAEWLGLSDKTTGRLIREMDERGLIRINRNVEGSGRNWSYTAKQAREATLVGLGEEVAREVAGSGECVLDAWEQVFEPDPPASEELPVPAEPDLRPPPEISFGRPPPQRPFDPEWDMKPADPRDRELVLAAAKARGIVPRWAAAA